MSYHQQILFATILIFSFWIVSAVQRIYPSQMFEPIEPTTCLKPTADILKCLSEWACRYPITVELRCLVNLNGTPLLGNLLGNGLVGGGNLLGGLFNR